MVLVDTSVWIRHFRAADPTLEDLLISTSALIHPFVIGELACGTLKNRQQILSDLRMLPPAVTAEEDEVLKLIEERNLWGRGIGWIDAHLLASTLLSHCSVWSLDAKLVEAARRCGVVVFR